MSDPIWSDHFEHCLVVAHQPDCKGRPLYEGCLDQGAFCADGCLSFNNGDFHLPVDKLAEFMTTLYTAAGKPEPVILERPREIAQVIIMPGASYSVRGNGIEATATCECRTSGQLLSTVAVRGFAVALACLCDVADSEPDPDEVGELARVLRGHTPGMAYPGEGDYRLAVARGYAEAALRWFRDRQQRGESRDAG